MRGIILAGGTATRLKPLTEVVNKHLLPVYNKPVIYYTLEKMAQAGIKDVLITTGAEHSGEFLNLLRSGKEFGLQISYEVQDEPRGLSDAVSLAEDFADNKKILVILGDNVFSHDLRPAVEKFKQQEKGAMIFAIPMKNPSQYGVVEIKEGKVVSLEEKPKNPKSDLVQTGIYMYDNQVFNLIKTLKPSTRGELEITDLNNLYLKQGQLSCEIMSGWWVDIGTSFDELYRANKLVAEKK
ncbi:NTP transferase domain-containing protein [Patescibacteria group bacterium]|nr:NTP transferase domain-containing protein [Patescibacteria group bacterium]